MRLVLGGISFPTIYAAAHHCRKILHDPTRTYNDTVTGEEALFLAALIEGHPSKAEKVGTGIDRFIIMHTGHRADNRGFGIVRRDGSRVDFSYKVALQGHVLLQKEAA